MTEEEPEDFHHEQNYLEEPLLKEAIPQIEKKSVRIYSGFLVIFVEFFERICYYSIVANLLLFCSVVLGISTSNALIIVLVFNGKLF
jgi:hypothetical protein